MTSSQPLTRAYDEMVDFIAAGTTPQSIIEFQPSESVRVRVSHLIAQEKNEGLSDLEKAELDRYLLLEHLLRLAKVRAQQYLQ